MNCQYLGISFIWYMYTKSFACEYSMLWFWTKTHNYVNIDWWDYTIHDFFQVRRCLYFLSFWNLIPYCQYICCLTLTGDLQHAWKCTVWAGWGHARKEDWKNLWENGFQRWWTFNETGVHRGLYEGPSPVSNAYGRCGYQPIMVPNRLFHFIYSSRFTKK